MKVHQFQTIELHQLAPCKPEMGIPCNGCGVCCAAEPCPVALLFLFQRKGSCRALLWQEVTGRYVCGMVIQPDVYSSLIPKRWRQGLGTFVASRIAAGIGCDSTIEVELTEHVD
jgi:hypothetical protein